MSLSSYYYQIQQKELNPKKEKMMIEIKVISQRTGNTYGKRRMLVELVLIHKHLFF